MQDHEKSRDQLIDELKELRRRVAELESAELAIEKTPKENDENTLFNSPPLISPDHLIETED